ncbi:hypothetical protein PENTCL1PPCAC_12382, partial [Pristionchus entomophagus]
NKNVDMIDYLANKYSNYSKNREDLESHLRRKYILRPKVIEVYCDMTPKLHRILRKLRLIDIRFRIFDDLLKMKFLSMVPFSF